MKKIVIFLILLMFSNNLLNGKLRKVFYKSNKKKVSKVYDFIKKNFKKIILLKDEKKINILIGKKTDNKNFLFLKRKNKIRFGFLATLSSEDTGSYFTEVPLAIRIRSQFSEVFKKTMLCKYPKNIIVKAYLLDPNHENFINKIRLMKIYNEKKLFGAYEIWQNISINYELLIRRLNKVVWSNALILFTIEIKDFYYRAVGIKEIHNKDSFLLTLETSGIVYDFNDIEKMCECEDEL